MEFIGASADAVEIVLKSINIDDYVVENNNA
jgi:hypothetical protein